MTSKKNKPTDWLSILERSYHEARANLPPGVSADPTIDRSGNRSSDAAAIQLGSDAQSALEASRSAIATGQSRSLPTYYHQSFGGKSQAELLEMRDWKRDQVPREFSMDQWRNIVRQQLQNWAKQATTPDGARSPGEENAAAILQQNGLSQSDRELLISPMTREIMVEPERFRRWNNLQQGEHPDTGQRIDREAEERLARQAKAQADADAIIAKAAEKPNSELTDPVPTRGGTALDMGQLVLDGIGVVDPSGAADGANAVLSLGRAVFDRERRGEHLKNAAISAVSILPYLGDLAKAFKIPGAAKTAKNAANFSDAAKVTRPVDDEAIAATLSDDEKIEQYTSRAREILERIGRRRGEQQTGTEVQADGGSGNPPNPPPTGPGADFTPPDPDDHRSKRDKEEEVTGRRRLIEKGKELAETFVGLTLGVGKIAVAFAGMFESVRLVNKANLAFHSHLEAFNGDIARALAQREIATVQRNLREGEGMAAALTKAARADTQMEDVRERFTTPVKSMFTDLTATLGSTIASFTELSDNITGVSTGLSFLSSVTSAVTDAFSSGARAVEDFVSWLWPFAKERKEPKQGTETTRLLDDIADGKLDGKSKAGDFFSRGVKQ